MAEAEPRHLLSPPGLAQRSGGHCWNTCPAQCPAHGGCKGPARMPPSHLLLIQLLPRPTDGWQTAPAATPPVGFPDTRSSPLQTMVLRRLHLLYPFPGFVFVKDNALRENKGGRTLSPTHTIALNHTPGKSNHLSLPYPALDPEGRHLSQPKASHPHVNRITPCWGHHRSRSLGTYLGRLHSKAALSGGHAESYHMVTSAF